MQGLKQNKEVMIAISEMVDKHGENLNVIEDNLIKGLENVKEANV